MTLLLDHKQCTPSVQLGHMKLGSAAQRSAVPCLALRFAVLCRAALCVLLTIQQQLLVVVVPGMIQIPVLCACLVYSSFCFLQFIVLSRSPCPHAPFFLSNIARTAVQKRDINKHTAQRRAISSAQALGIIINSLFAPNNHGPLLPAPCICMF